MFPQIFKTAVIQNVIYTTLGNDITVTVDNVFLYVPAFFPDTATQRKINDSIFISFNISFDTWFTDRRVVDTGLECQLDIGSPQGVNSHKQLTALHQTAARMEVPKKANIVAIIDILDVRNYVVENDGVGYAKEPVNVNYAANDYIDPYRDLKIFSRENVREELFNLL